jgi:alpha-beta hydrolase superfamily lysophospholipase
MKKIIFLFIISNLWLPGSAYENVSFKTENDCDISAFYQKSSSGTYIFVNAHGLGSSKEEWLPFQKVLTEKGFGFLSFDIRGHGKSLKCGKRSIDYKFFNEEDWAKLSNDFLGAVSFLVKKGIGKSKIIFCGASIGSSLALKAATEMKGEKIKYLVLLSPGLAYAKIRTDEILPRLIGTKVLIAASPEDRYAWMSSGSLLDIANKKNIKAQFIAGPGGHGVNMFRAKKGIFIRELLKVLFH